MAGRRRMSPSGNSSVISQKYHRQVQEVQSTKNGEGGWKKKLPSIIGHLLLVYGHLGVLSAVCCTVNWLIFAFLSVISAFSKANFLKNGHFYWNLPKQLVLSFVKEKRLWFFVIFLCLLQNAVMAGDPKQGRALKSDDTIGDAKPIDFPLPVIKPEYVTMNLPMPTVIPRLFQVPFPVAAPIAIPMPAPMSIALAIPIPVPMSAPPTPANVTIPSPTKPPPGSEPEPPLLAPARPQPPAPIELAQDYGMSQALAVVAIIGGLLALIVVSCAFVCIVISCLLLCKAKKRRPRRPRRVRSRNNVSVKRIKARKPRSRK